MSVLRVRQVAVFLVQHFDPHRQKKRSLEASFLIVRRRFPTQLTIEWFCHSKEWLASLFFVAYFNVNKCYTVFGL